MCRIRSLVEPKRSERSARTRERACACACARGEKAQNADMKRAGRVHRRSHAQIIRCRTEAIARGAERAVNQHAVSHLITFMRACVSDQLGRKSATGGQAQQACIRASTM